MSEKKEALPVRSTKKERVERLLRYSEFCENDPESILFQHSVLCQTCLPYRNPGDDVSHWERTNGFVHLEVTTRGAWDREQKKRIPVGLPYGPKPRLLLAHLNAEALRQKSPVIEVEDTITAFIKRLNIDPNGRNIKTVKDQLTRLSHTNITLNVDRDNWSVEKDIPLVTTRAHLWSGNDDQKRPLWPSIISLSSEYYNNLSRHAVPLHNGALRALSGNAMALDQYAWLAQRLHRIPQGKPSLVPWKSLHEQFGWSYKRIRKFREVFLTTLRDVLLQYRAARVEVTSKGLELWNSPSPVKGRTAIFFGGGVQKESADFADKKIVPSSRQELFFQVPQKEARGDIILIAQEENSPIQETAKIVKKPAQKKAKGRPQKTSLIGEETAKTPKKIRKRGGAVSKKTSIVKPKMLGRPKKSEQALCDAEGSHTLDIIPFPSPEIEKKSLLF